MIRLLSQFVARGVVPPNKLDMARGLQEPIELPSSDSPMLSPG